MNRRYSLRRADLIAPRPVRTLLPRPRMDMAIARLEPSTFWHQSPLRAA